MAKFLRDRNRANRRLETANAELSDTYETVKLQNRLLNNKTKQIEEQRNELERKNNQIIDSISSASRIQKAIRHPKQPTRQNIPKRLSVLSVLRDSNVPSVRRERSAPKNANASNVPRDPKDPSVLKDPNGKDDCQG